MNIHTSVIGHACPRGRAYRAHTLTWLTVTRGNLNTATLAQTGKNPSRPLPAILITQSKPRDRFHPELDRVINIKLMIKLNMIKPNRSQVAEISWFEVVELGHLLVGERKAPEVEIRGHVRGVVRASDDGDAALKTPLEDHLCRRGVVRGRDGYHLRVGQDVAMVPAERAPRLQLDPVLGAKRQHVFVVIKRVPLDLHSATDQLATDQLVGIHAIQPVVGGAVGRSRACTWCRAIGTVATARVSAMCVELSARGERAHKRC